jgi:hypothetical protein
MKISGLLTVMASRKIIARRRSYCMRPPPSCPFVADWMAIGLRANG